MRSVRLRSTKRHGETGCQSAFEIGHLYEEGLSNPTAAAPGTLQPDLARAWSWYQKGADVSEPSALARFAERDESNALAENDPSKRNADLLKAFTFYAAAAEQAHDEDWPDEAWRNWRYRRATLARFLAREGMMQQIADAYIAVRDKRTSHTPTLWEEIEAKFHL
jgi:TPR repeat protein